MKKMVYLVGAGPGDPGLLTVRAQQLIQLAAVIIYDALVSRAIVDRLPSTAKLVYVGKRAGQHALKQDEINEVLVREGSSNDGIVVRLKGGDPFVFGRGGEEVEALIQAGLSYEVVPGISAGIAAPAYFGIPVTHRGMSRSVTLITASSLGDGQVPDLPWETLVALDGTLVFYMGMRWVSYIAQRMVEFGMTKEQLAAIVSQGTLPNQVLLSGTIEEFSKEDRQYDAYSPGLFVVGDVVTLANSNQWYQTLPLAGKRVLVTRSEAQASDLVNILSRLGADSVLLPTIEIVRRDARQQILNVLNSCSSAWLVFTSPNAVLHFVEQLFDVGMDIRSLAKYKVASIGPATTRSLKSYGIISDFVPSNYDSNTFLDDFVSYTRESKMSVILPTSDLSSGIIARGLAVEGYVCHTLDVYDNRPLDYTHEDLSRLDLERVDWITFCSSSAVHNFMSLVKVTPSLSNLLKRVRVASIGVSTTATLKEYGILEVVQPDKPSLQMLGDSIVTATRSNGE